MCGPTLALVGTAVSTFAGLQRAQAQAAAARSNAQFLDRRARIERDRADFDAQRARERHLRRAGQQRANALASGIDLSGSALDAIEDSAIEAELDQAAIRYGGEISAGNFEHQARQQRQRASNIRTQSIFGALAPVIQGAGRTYIRGAFG